MADDNEYEKPWRAYIGLGVLFLALAITGLITVFIPEIQDDPAEAPPAALPAIDENNSSD